MSLRLAIVLAVGVSIQTAASAAELTAEKSDDGQTVVVKIDGRRFAEYLVRSGDRPIVWPIYGPTDQRMTRDFPMKDTPGEAADHVHHRSLWCGHGRVNGIDFWTLQGKHGSIRHLEFTTVSGGRQATIATRNAWVAPNGRRVLEDARTLRFDGDAEARWIDFDISLKATDGPVVFGDTKEGFFAIRVAEGLRVDAQRGAKIVNSAGQTDQKAWGQPAAWVDVRGPVDGQTVGIAMFNHPNSERYPTRWHVRTYGLMAANPFGRRQFTGDRKAKGGDMTLAAGESATFRYRVLLHKGDERQGKVAQRFAEYAK